MSPTRKDTLYIGAQFLFRSRDHGNTWQRISPDLTTNDPAKQKQEQSGGITVDNSEAEMHTTIFSISESPRNPNVIWVGTDDGNLQLTRNGGRTWTNVVGHVTGLPPYSWVSWVEASRFAPGTAYAAFDRHTFGDMTPWVYKTTDYGKTWTRIVSPAQGVRGWAHVIREEPSTGTSSSSAPSSACGSRSTAAARGPSSRAAPSPACRSATSRSRRASATW